MKIFALLAFAFCNGLFANYVGNPQAPDFSNFVPPVDDKSTPQKDAWIYAYVDYEKEYCSDMALLLTAGTTQQRCEFSSFAGNFLSLTANLFHHLAVYAKGGSVFPLFDFSATNPAGVTFHLQTEPRTLAAWAVGVKCLVYKIDNVCFSIESSYFQTQHHSIDVYSVVAPSSPVKSSLSWYNWQVSAGMSYQVKMLIPYMGLKYSGTHVSLDAHLPTLGPFKMENRRKFGLFLGTTVLSSRYIDFNVEGRLIDEQSFSATLGVRY